MTAPSNKPSSSSVGAKTPALPLWLVLVRHVTRLDARSLGLFRIAFGLVLIGDLFTRIRYVADFYSN